MTADNAIVARLAREVMGWSIHVRFDGKMDVHWSDGNWKEWNPLESIADAFEVQTELLKNPRLASIYAYRLNDMAYNGLAVCPLRRVIAFLLSATPRQRCEAAIAALDQVGK